MVDAFLLDLDLGLGPCSHSAGCAGPQGAAAGLVLEPAQAF